MGIIYNVKSGRGYINTPKCRSTISLQRATTALTRQNIQFLKSLKLKVVANPPRGGKYTAY